MAKTKHRRSVLIMSHDKIGSNMAGPGIRYHYMAEELSDIFNVTIGFFDPTYPPGEEFKHSYETRHIDAHKYEQHFKDFDVIIALWLGEGMIDFCNRNDIFVVFDLYAPVPVESLASYLFSGKSIKPEDDFEYKTSLLMYRKFFENGDLFLVSNRRQLDYWTGYVFGADQIRLSTYDKRPIYDRFIYAPMGIDPRTPLKHTKDVIKGVLPNIKKTDTVLLWTGGIWGWYDGLILMRVMKRLLKKRPDIKLVFFGTQHPNPNVPEMKESFATRTLAKELGLTNKNVFFNEGWVSYPDRINYLLEADVAINTHKASIETEFSHRTRVLDHILATLPTISTEGDYLSDTAVNTEGMGITVPASDEDALEQAIIAILKPKKYDEIKHNIAEKRNDYTWSATMQTMKNILLENPDKLHQLEKTEPIKTHNKAMRVAKKYVPVPVKKGIIRVMRYGSK